MLFLALLTYLSIEPLYGIKLFSIFFDFIIAIISACIILNTKQNNKKLYATLIYGIQLFLPTVILNSSWWAQCDSIYTAFIFITLWLAIKEKYCLAFIFMGVGLSFKLHIMMFIPVLLVIWMRSRKFNLLEFFNIPLVYFIISMPALLAGKNINDIFKILISYGSGATGFLTLNFNNFYTLITSYYGATNYGYDLTEYIISLGRIITIVLVGLSMVIFISKKIELNDKNIIGLALFYIILITYFLPGMHERYLFAGDVLSTLYFILKKDLAKWYIPLAINLVSITSYFMYITGPIGELENFMWFNRRISFIYLFIVIYILKEIYKDMTYKNEIIGE